ncbi:restriction endonuclease subunit S [Prevotella stercorea]|uniref:restriction endonuclease subunit S n=2 Tax=Prevotellaceae TaxID=171552 RepID=UPI001F320522|nr:restriction endonuclease subunit S [Leyella stercorea]MCF2578216.1 restriction endonuclease subunit S [Leyella stercorea]
MSSYYEKILATGEVKCIDEEVPFEIPASWSWARLTHVTYLIEDCPHSTAKDEGKGYPLVRTPNIGFGFLQLNGVHRVSEKVYNQRNVRAVPQKDDLIFAREAPAGNIAVIQNEKVCLGQRTVLLRPITDCILPQYLAYYVLAPSSQQNLVEKSSGTTVAHVNLSDFRPYLIAVPPIDEQKQIVNKLIELLSLIDKYNCYGDKLAKLNNEIYTLLKKSILQEAIQGKLVPQIIEDGTAYELLEQIKAEKQNLVKEGKLKKSALATSVIFRGDDNRYYEKVGKKCVDITEEIPFEIPASWAWCHLNDIAESDLGKTMNKGQNLGELVPYLCSINVYWNKIDLSKIKQAQFTEIELAKYLLQKNDLLICEGGDIGRAAIWDINETMYYQNALHRVRFYGKIFPKFFLYILSLYKALGLLDKKSKGMTIKHFTKSALNSIVIPLPPLLEQKRIIEKIEQLMQLLK